MKLISGIYASIARHVVQRISTDIDFALQLQARDSSADFVASNMPTGVRLPNRDSLLRDAVERVANIPGCICEFGVYSGYTLRLIASIASNRTIHGFDSFEGLPTDWRPGFPQGTFKTKVPIFDQKNIQLHIGWFNETLIEFSEKFPENIAFAHIDCDLYSSTKCVLENIAPKLSEGAILVFDEYFNYPGWKEHEHKALQEAISDFDLAVTYLGFTPNDQQVYVQVHRARVA